jgi:hypothetical protein
MMPRPDDEHMSVPTWRMKQLQDIEHAAREAVELIAAERSVGSWLTPSQADARRASALGVVGDLLTEALGE